MATNLKLVATLFIVFVVATNSTCKKPCVRNQYGFGLGIKAFPNLDSINIGDTLWIEIDESVNLKDGITGNYINYPGAVNLGSNLSFQKYENSNYADAVSNFDFFLVNGIETSNAKPSLFKEYLFKDINGRYKFKLGIILKINGIYRISLGSAQNVYTNSEPCSKAGFVFNFENSINLHRYLVGYTGPPIAGGDYYFKVK